MVRLIEWTLAGAPEGDPLPEGAAEMLASQRRADLFTVANNVDAFGPPAAELIRRAVGLPEVLTRWPDGIVPSGGPYLLADGVAAMLLNETDWTELEWPTCASLRGYLFRQARRILWKQMREDERVKRRVVCAALEAQRHRPRVRKELLRDIEKAFASVKKSMPELDRYCRTLRRAADDRTAAVDLSRVAKIYGIPESQVRGFVDLMERRWSSELETLRNALSLYVKRRPVRFDAESGRFRIVPDEAA
jgi:hypothetical protein